jgi:hypothetical protein
MGPTVSVTEFFSKYLFFDGESTGDVFGHLRSPPDMGPTVSMTEFFSKYLFFDGESTGYDFGDPKFP